MKNDKVSFRIYCISSISIVFIYFLAIMFLDQNLSQNFIPGFLLPALSCVNAIIIVPIVLRRNFTEASRKSFLKKLYVLSIILTVLGTVGVYVAVIGNHAAQWQGGWIIVGVLAGHIIWILLFVCAILLTALFLLIYLKTKRINESLKCRFSYIFRDFLCPFFFISLLLWSFMILSATIYEVM